MYCTDFAKTVFFAVVSKAKKARGSGNGVPFYPKLRILQGAVMWELLLLLTPPPTQYLTERHKYLETKLVNILTGFVVIPFCYTLQTIFNKKQQVFTVFWVWCPSFSSFCWNLIPAIFFSSQTTNLRKSIYFWHEIW